MKSIQLPSSIKTIGSNAFGSINPLKSIVIPSTTTSIHSKTFNSSKKVVLKCKKNSTAYKYVVKNKISKKSGAHKITYSTYVTKTYPHTLYAHWNKA